jgi:hypothetical protein
MLSKRTDELEMEIEERKHFSSSLFFLLLISFYFPNIKKKRKSNWKCVLKKVCKNVGDDEKPTFVKTSSSLKS